MPDFEAGYKNKVPFQTLVNEELVKVRDKIAPFNSLHEVYGFLSEEVAEFFDEVRKKRDDREPAAVLEELVQIAGIAQRACEDFDIAGVSLEDSEYKAKYEALRQDMIEFHKILLSRARPLINSLQRDRMVADGISVKSAHASQDSPFMVNLLASEIKAFGERLQ